MLTPLSIVNTRDKAKTKDYWFFLERDIIGMRLLLILQKTILETCRVAHHGEFVRSIFEGLALLDFSDLEASIESTESTEMTDACGRCAGGKTRPVFLWQSSNGARLSGWDVDSHGFHTSFLIMACHLIWTHNTNTTDTCSDEVYPFIIFKLRTLHFQSHGSKPHQEFWEFQLRQNWEELQSKMLPLKVMGTASPPGSASRALLVLLASNQLDLSLV